VNLLSLDKRLASSSWKPPRWFRLWMIWASRAGNGPAWLFAVAIACGLLGSMKPFIWVCTSVALGQGVFLRLKRLYRRTRQDAPDWHPVRPWCFDSFSFPSGHAVTAFAVATSLSAFYPAWLVPLYLFAGNVAASRVVLRLHYLSDVLVGCCIGWGCGKVALWLASGV